jgi:hypothetical protein
LGRKLTIPQTATPVGGNFLLQNFEASSTDTGNKGLSKRNDQGDVYLLSSGI